jgi:predicted O-methyltransferase YrrM
VAPSSSIKDRDNTTVGLLWLDDDVLEIDGQRFFTTGNTQVMASSESTPDRLLLAKTRDHVERFAERMRSFEADTVFELGIFKGGSTALLYQLLHPRKLVAVDIDRDPVPALETYVHQRNLEPVFQLHYGVDQSDTARLHSILDGELDDERLDLVVDDASHSYPETRATFEALFPRLRPGGRYIVEDWAWAHFDEELWQRDGGFWRDRPALTNLVVETMLLLGSFSDIVADIHIDPDFAEITRGTRDLPSRLDLSSMYLNRGNLFRPLL